MNKFPEYDLDIRLKDIFPPVPDTNVPSSDIQQRIASLPVYIRTQTCETFCWNMAKYYRKLSGIEVMTAEEEKKFIEFASKALKKYYDYVLNRYILPKRRVRKKKYKEFN